MNAPQNESYIKPIERVLDRLDGVEQHNGYFKALCSVHGDTNPSLSVSEGDDGRVLLNCFVGCETAEIVASMGLTMRDLFECPNVHRGEGGTFIPPKTIATLQPCNLGKILPDLERLQGCTVAVVSEGIEDPPTPLEVDDKHIPRWPPKRDGIYHHSPECDCEWCAEETA